MSYIDNTRRIPKYGGIIYYVSDTLGLDTNSGIDPTKPLKTIGAAIAKLTAGDAINIMAGTYTEVGLDLNVNSCEL